MFDKNFAIFKKKLLIALKNKVLTLTHKKMVQNKVENLQKLNPALKEKRN